jgi:predicted MPP superfamily phosphohydrolase
MQISDLHIGPVVNRSYLEQARRVMLAHKADILVVTGDIIDNNNYYLGLAQDFFASIKSHFPLGIYGVLGNHDFIDDGEEVSRAMSEVGVRMLRNEAVPVSSSKGSWHLIGLDYPMHTWRESSSRTQVAARYLKQALDGRGKKQEGFTGIALNHHPSDFPLFARHDIPLTLAGHTHGGQIVVPGTDFAPVGDFFSYSRGGYHLGQKHLYVNSGLGHWFPLRVQCDPEITLLQLT